MKTFHTGDRVRVTHGKDLEGIVLGRDKHGLVQVEMTDGFAQSFPDKELSLVNTVAETAAFTKQPTIITRSEAGPTKAAEARPRMPDPRADALPSAAVSRKGIFLGLSAPIIGSQARELVLLNNTDLYLALVVGYARESRYQTDKVLVAGPKLATILMEVPAKHLQDRPTFQLWAHAALPGQTAHPAPIHMVWHLPADFKDRPLLPAPVSGKPMLFVELEGPGLSNPTPQEPRVLGALPGGKLVQEGKKSEPALTGKAIAEAMMAPKPPTATPPPPQKVDMPDELDLHIEKLSPHAAKLSSDEILQEQLRAFEAAFDLAQTLGKQSLTLIHGTSNTPLRTALHRRLSGASQNGLIAHFEDYQKDRYGYNATRITFHKDK